MRVHGCIDSADQLGLDGHACWSFDRRREFTDAVLEFLTEGLRLGQRIAFMADEPMEAQRQRRAKKLIEAKAIEKSFAGHLLFSPDNTYDIGASGGNQPRHVYVGNRLYVGSGNVTLRGASSGVLAIMNGAETDFSRLQFGGTTSSFPALKRSGTALEAVLADDSAFAALRATSYRFGSTGPFLVSGAGSPEGVTTAPIGSLFLRSDGGAGTTLYVKESGTGSTGWVAMKTTP